MTTRPTYILRSAEGDTSDARDALEAKGKESFPRLTLRAGLDLVERGLGGGVLLMGVVVTLVVGVVRVNLLNGGRHLCGQGILASALWLHPSERRRDNPSASTRPREYGDNG